MHRNSKTPKLTLQAAVTQLREAGFKPNFKAGELVDWRRIKGHHLQTAKVTVHTSGRTTIHHRSTADGKERSNSSRRKNTTA